MESISKHGPSLEPKLRKFEERLKRLSLNDEIWFIIHHPGYTTPAEFAFVSVQIETMNALVDVLEKNLTGFYQGSKLIISEKG